MATKNKIHAQLKMIKHLNNISQSIADNIINSIPSADDKIKNLLSHIEIFDVLDTDAILRNLTMHGYVTDDDTNDSIAIPDINIDPEMLTCDISVPVNGGKLTAYTCRSDYNTQQVGIGYECNDNIIDLALAEVKSGQLAETDGLPSDNKDIDLYTYSDPYNEDYTAKNHITYNSITDALNDI